MEKETDYLLFLKAVGTGWVFWAHFKSREAANDSAEKLIAQGLLQIQDWKALSVEQIVGESPTEE